MDVVKITSWFLTSGVKGNLPAADVEHDCGIPRARSVMEIISSTSTRARRKRRKYALNYRHEVDPDYGEILQERSRKFRQLIEFKGGTVLPIGLGIKR